MAHRPAATEFPLPLCQVLEEEIEALLPEAGAGSASPQPDGPWEFTPDQIRPGELPGLLARLRDPGDEVSRWLREQLSPDFCQRLAHFGGDDGPRAWDLREPLAEELNRLLREEELRPKATAELAQACRVARIRLPDDLERLLADPPKDKKRLLRMLLEEVFPAELEAGGERRLQEVYRRIHAHPHGLAALCLSGGGIRSAVFALGIVQGLARRNLLHAFDYLSTVSGGGYLGGLLSAWIHRHPRGLEGVSDELGGLSPEKRKLRPEPPPLEYMRDYSNYLSPKLGILSADSWTLISIFLRNLYVYWLVLVPLLLAVLVLPRLYVSLCTQPSQSWGSVQVPWTSLHAFLVPDGLFVLGSLLMMIAIGYIGWNRPSGGQRSTPRGFLLCCLLPLVASAVVYTVYWCQYRGLDDRGIPGRWWFVLPSMSINVFGWSVHALPALARGRVRPLAKLRELPCLGVAGAVGGLLAMLAATVLFRDPKAPGVAPWFGVFAVPCVLAAFVVGETVFAGLVSRWTDDEDREWWSRSAAWLLIVVAAWVAVSGAVIYGPVLLAEWRWILTPVGGLTGVATALLARSSFTESRGSKE